MSGVGVALRVGLRAERPALAGEAVERIVKMLRSLRDRAVFIHGRAADEPPEAVILESVGADRLAVPSYRRRASWLSAL